MEEAMNKIISICLVVLFLSLSVCNSSVNKNMDLFLEDEIVTAQKIIHSSKQDFYYAKSVDELLSWIKIADINENYNIFEHFLNVATKHGSILTVDTKNNGFILDTILVQNDKEYMVYYFLDENDNDNAIYVIINLSIWETSENQGKSIDKSLARANFKSEMTIANIELNNMFIDAPQYIEKNVKINGENIPLYYYNGQDSIDIENNEIRTMFTTAKFEIGNAQVSIKFHGAYPNGLFYEKWDDKYLDFFEFNEINIK